ncbi:MAG: nucleotidyltransferase family protein [Novosphingobium sp.]
MSPLFTLLWGDERRAAELAAKLLQKDWQTLDIQATQHRLRPLLHQRRKAGEWPAPPDLIEQWQASYQRSGIRTLGQKAALTQIGAALAAANLSATVLKGGALIWSNGHDPALRPMRDIDLLIEPAQAGRVFEALSQAGYTGGGIEPLNSAKHLPPLVARQSTVELHLHLFDTHDDAAAAREREFAARVRQRVQAAAVPGLFATGATDTLLHLILHAVLDHQFNNGPLLLSDMQLLIGSGKIDWPLFWDEADRLEATRACQLALGLGHELTGIAVDWRLHAPFRPDPALAERITRLMLVDEARRSVVGWPGQLLRLSPLRWPRLLLQMLRRRIARENSGDASESATGFGGAIGKALGAQGRSDIADAVRLSLWLKRE